MRDLTHTGANYAKLGIFWLFENRLIFHCTPLDSAERYGDCLTSPVSHIDHWTELQRRRDVPREVEYEEHPRGRVVFNVNNQEFTVYADRCILQRRDAVSKIIAEAGLPEDVKIATDEHYRCYRCLYGSADDEDEE